MSNVYYSPEAFGLTVVAELDEQLYYEFDTTVVWRHESGQLYWAHDSGCSCPTPFENFRGLEDLYRLPDDYELLRQTIERQSVSDLERLKFLNAIGR